MIDWTRVARLRDEIGAEDFDEVAELFLMEVEHTLGLLDGAASDVVQMEEHLHFLKGSALNLGFAAFSEMCRAGEEAAARGELVLDLGELVALYDTSRAVFEEEYAVRFVA